MKRILPALWAALFSALLAAPALAASPAQSQLMLKATGDDGYICHSTGLGSYAADALRQAANADLAFLPSGLLGLNLPAGVVDEAVLAESFPLDEPVYAVTLTAPQLRATLETACSRLALDETERLDREASRWDGFLQLSGLKVIYNVSALPGSRLWSAQREDGGALDLDDPQTTYTAAVPQSFLEGGYGYPAPEVREEIGTLRQLVGARISAEGIAREPERRIILYGARENEIISYFPPGLIIFAVVLMALFSGRKWRRSATFER